MADENLTVLLRLEGKADQLIAEMGKVGTAQKKVKDGAKEAAKEQESWFDNTRKGLEKVRAAWGEYQGTLGVAKAAYGFLKGAADSFAASNEEAGKKWKAAKAEWDRGFDSIRNGIGQIVVALSPLIGALGKVVSLVGDIVQAATGEVGAELKQYLKDATSGQLMAAVEAQNRLTAASISRASQWLIANGESGPAMPSWSGVNMSKESQLQDQFKRGHISKKEYDREMAKLRGGGGGGSGGDYQLNAIELDGLSSANATYSMRSIYELGEVKYSQAELDRRYGERLARHQEIQDYNRGSLLSQMGSVVPNMDEVTRFQSQLGEQLQGQRTSYLEQIFGPLDQFNAYAAGFETLSSVVTAAYGAWIDGTSSVADAIKGTLAASLKSMGMEMAVNALKETAYGFASLAWGPIGGASAAAHFKSAGLFALGAAAAGVAAKGVNGTLGGGGGGGGYSGGANLGGMGGGGGTAATHHTVIIGDYFGANPREQNGRVARALRSARKEISDDSGGGVRFS